MQLTFGDAECLGKRRQTRRTIFLAEMEHIIPWQQLLALIEPHYLVSGWPGRQPFSLATMSRIHLLQQWYALSDPALEEVLHLELKSAKLFGKSPQQRCESALKPPLKKYYISGGRSAARNIFS